MTLFAVRVTIFTLLPLLTAGLVLLIDRSANTRERRIEVFLVFLFALGVAGSGIGGFFGHLFLSDQVAEAVGWPAGSPFQLEMGFANLALGVLGIIAVGRRDGFREATVIAVSIIGFGATTVHIMDIIDTGNLAPGNTIQNFANLVRPILLIGLLIAARKAESKPDSEAGTIGFDQYNPATTGRPSGKTRSPLQPRICRCSVRAPSACDQRRINPTLRTARQKPPELVRGCTLSIAASASYLHASGT